MRRFAKARVRRTPGKMNGLETDYAARLTADLVEWRYEALTFRLADRTTFTPDFMVIVPDLGSGPNDSYIELHEVKGFMYDDAWVKLKVAAEMYPEFRWFLATRARKKDGGAWTIKEIGE